MLYYTYYCFYFFYHTLSYAIDLIIIITKRTICIKPSPKDMLRHM